ncbi:phenylacetate-CoA ligase [Roseimicrobium gellanilyticum]|uniref:Phenylacetate-CoA ligase n=1 Tax=Roseimicrobium gellanilyticum TaxID=748857 RepID=A0A366H8D0_9BACT|nr:phenylacetate--CoA ligase family protein [Roseimicrobium gellanilyticum]RBP38489.1 phenylacetate-CoA ligase [Roseimicrobium gellanilyticum]
MNLRTLGEPLMWAKALWERRTTIRLSREQLEAQQLRKFRRFVAYVQKRSPYYQKIIQERGIDPATCVPTDFPVLTKRDVMANFDDIVTDRRITRERVLDFLAKSKDPGELFEDEYHVLHTSGTSGTMGVYVYSREGWIKGASNITRVAPPRLRRRSAFVAATRGHFAGVSLMVTGNRGTNRLFYNVRTYDVGRPMPEIIADLNKFQPHALSGYAAVLKVLGEAQERGELKIKPELVGNGGEPLMPEVKTLLQRAFKAPVSNAYATSELLYMGLTLPDSGPDGSMHLMEDNLIFELHDDHTCVTNLFNEVMPLIRYRLDDVLVPDTESENNLPFTKIRGIVGRAEDALVFTNSQGKEDFIHPIVIVELVIPGLNAWQVVLESKTSFRFRARFEPGQSEAEQQATKERIMQTVGALLAEKDMGNVKFTIEPVEEMEIDKHSGKFRLVVRDPALKPPVRA